MLHRLRIFDRRVTFALIACALLMRMLVPAGWMPTTGSDGAMRISLCSGMGVETAWIDRDGKVHKDAPPSGQHDPKPCGFGALGFALDSTPDVSPLLPATATEVVVLTARQTVSVGHGLAAPPPPATGPPSLI